MIGFVSPQLMPMIRLWVKNGGNETEVDLIVDTGFNGTLSLSSHIIAQLSPPFIQWIESTLADGSVIEIETYSVEIEWNGKTRPYAVSLTAGDSLIGTAMLENHELHIEVRDGGTVTISPLAN